MLQYQSTLLLKLWRRIKINQAPIVLFEPICRGSRLQILANTITAIREYSSRPIKIVTRADYDSVHFKELMCGCLAGVQIVPASTNLGGAWIKILDSQEMMSMVFALERACKGVKDADIVFMALDEYLLSILGCAGKLTELIHKHRIFVVKYRVEYLLARHCNSLRSLLLRLATIWALRRLKAHLICFDERFAGQKIAGSPIAILPDPWFGGFHTSRRELARVKHSFAVDDFVVLTLGRQDRRKGFPLVLEILPRMFSAKCVRLFVVGNIAPEYIDRFAALKGQFPDRIRHVDVFVDEEDLPDIFACADVFLLPYSSDFTATSGTLPRAAASGVPVVTGRHGLVGHRVSVATLGETCDISSPASLLGGIRKVQSYSNEEKSAVVAALGRFAASTHISKFEACIGKIFASDKCKVQE